MSRHPRPDRRPRLAATRREFLSCCALAMASAGCANLGPRIRSAYVFANDPELGAYRSVFRGLTRAVLPLEDPSFPLSAGEVEHQLLDLFHFEDDERYERLQQMLLFFDDLDLFSFPLAMMDAERVARDAAGRNLDAAEVLANARDIDRRLGETFVEAVAPTTHFTALGVEDQRRYLDLWARSGFLVKRRFYSAAKALIMIAAYSQDGLWPAIGYDGPHLPTNGVS